MSVSVTVHVRPGPAVIDIVHFPPDDACGEFWSVRIGAGDDDVSLIIYDRQQAELWRQRAAIVGPVQDQEDDR